MKAMPMHTLSILKLCILQMYFNVHIKNRTILPSCVLTAYSVQACCCFVLNMTPNSMSTLLCGYPWDSLFVLTHYGLFYAVNSSHDSKWRQSLARRFSSPCCLARSNTRSCLASPGFFVFFSNTPMWIECVPIHEFNILIS